MPYTSSSAWGEEETKFFFALTPDKIFAAVERLGLRCTGRIFQLNSMENRVYEVEVLLPDNPEKTISYIAKFYRPGRWTREQLLDEHRFLLDLEEYDLPVISPFRTAGGETLATLEDVSISYALFPKARGRTPEELNHEQLARLGRLIARVHNVGAIREAPARIELNPQTYAIGNLDFLLSNDIVPAEIADNYEHAVLDLCDLIAPLFEGVKTQRIHGDCHLGNILWGDDGPFLVDFDDMVRGPCVQDLWLMLPGNDEYAMRSRDVLINAYEEMRVFDRSTLELIEPLRALRYIHFAAWIARRWDDPAFPKVFPSFGTPRYWQEQLLDLREQIALIEEGPQAPVEY